MMGATIELFKSSVLGFDLDTKRPWFKDQAAAEAYMSGRAGKTWRSTNWNRIGDPMIAPLTFTEASGYDIGMITLDIGPNQLDGIKYWFRVRDVRVNETNRTEIVYDIDFLQTFQYWLGTGHATRVPKGFEGGRGVVLDPLYWYYEASTPLFTKGINLIIVAKQAKIDGQDKKGPVYFLTSCKWNTMQGGVVVYNNVIGELVTHGVFQATDIVNAWVVPALFDYDTAPSSGNLAFWEDFALWSGASFYWIKWTNSTPLAHYEAHVVPTLPASMDSGRTFPASEGDPSGDQSPIFVGTNTAEGKLTGICDERGNILFTFKDKVDFYDDFFVGVNISMATCEVDIVLNGREWGFVSGHTADYMFTYSCRPIDTVADAYTEYLARQRQADIDNRKLQNEAGLVGGMANAGSGALMGAAMGSVVPGIGTVAGAIAGGLTSIVGSAVNYGVSSVYGEKEQAIVDRTYKLAQDIVAVNGMITSYQLALQQTLFLFQLQVDPDTKAHLNTRLMVEGEQADMYMLTTRNFMNSAFSTTEFRPFAATCEVNYDMPASWKKTISAQLAAGARYKKFGTWT